MEALPLRTVHVNELARRAGLTSSTLLTRPYGRRFLPFLEALVQELDDTQALVLDFGDIEIMDASFADEVFSTMAVNRSRRISRSGCIVLAELEGASLENLDMALASRTVRELGLRNCVLPVQNHGRDIRLVGKSEAHVQASFDLLIEHCQLTARELADALDLDIAAASTRLKVLFDLGLATRTEEREGPVKQFVYQWPL